MKKVGSFEKMEAPPSSRRAPLPALAAAAALACSRCSSSPAAVEAFAAPRARAADLGRRCRRSPPSSSTRLAVSIGLGPEQDPPPPPSAEEGAPPAEGVPYDSARVILGEDDPYDPARVVLGEDGLPMPHVVDFEPYRKDRMSDSDRACDAWFRSLLDGDGGGDGEGGFLGPVSKLHRDRLLTPVELADPLVLKYGEDEEWTPYVSRRLPTSPLYPAYGLEAFGLPVPRRGAEAWRHFDVNGMVAVDYSGRPEGIGTDLELDDAARDAAAAELKEKGAWLDDDDCAGRLVYVDGRYCPALSKPADAPSLTVRNLDASAFEGGLPDATLDRLSRLPDGHTDDLAAPVPDDFKGPQTSLSKLSGPDHNVGPATSQFAINNQQGAACFAALNSVKAGCVAYVEAKEEGGRDERPALIVHAQTPSGGIGDGAEGGKGGAIHPRTLCVAGDGAAATLVQMSVDLGDPTSAEENPVPTLVNGYTQIYVGENANVTHTLLEESGGTATSRVEMSDDEAASERMERSPREVEASRPALRDAHFHCVDAHVVGDSGRYAVSFLGLGGIGRSRTCLSASLLRPGAHASLNGFALSGGAQRSDVRTQIHHAAQGTTSQQEQRNMVGGRSTAAFRGRIRVEQSAQQTDAQQLSRTMILSDHGRIWATPSLEIIADDVQCTHGATVSDLSEEELFYLRSRGLDRTMSRNLLMYAFVEEVAGQADRAIAGEFDDEKGLRSRIIKRLENLVPTGDKELVGGEFQSV
ncbi:hypothetical protein ACHAWF_011799 [Thalassiosira exigua]